MMMTNEKEPKAATTRPVVGRTLAGRYHVVAALGSGGMYRATQLALEREVAIKVLDASSADEASEARFIREARAHGLLTSPHTVRVIDHGSTDDGEHYLVMDLLHGESLRARLARLGRLPAEVAIDVCLQVLRSLAEAHAKGIVHRDLKPEHVFFARASDGSDDEVAKVVDFGIAKRVDHQAPDGIETRRGFIVGTPHYMSPEQTRGEPAQAASDLYALGVVLYEMLTGRPPFDGASAVVVMAQHARKPAEAPSVACPEARVPPALDALVVRALAKDPAERPASADAMWAELSAMRDGADASANARASAGEAGAAARAEAEGQGETVPEPGIAVVARRAGLAFVCPPRVWIAGGVTTAVLAALVVTFGVLQSGASASEPDRVTAAPLATLGTLETLAAAAPPPQAEAPLATTTAASLPDAPLSVTALPDAPRGAKVARGKVRGHGGH